MGLCLKISVKISFVFTSVFVRLAKGVIMKVWALPHLSFPLLVEDAWLVSSGISRPVPPRLDLLSHSNCGCSFLDLSHKITLKITKSRISCKSMNEEFLTPLQGSPGSPVFFVVVAFKAVKPSSRLLLIATP